MTIKIHDRVETLPVDALIPYARNSRTHSDEQIAQIAASIREFGFSNPVLVDEVGNIIAGHGRVLAARRLGMEGVPCLRMEGLSETQKRAYVIADNSLALASGWDEDLLKAELDSLKTEELDLDILGFDADFIAELYEPGKMSKSFDRKFGYQGEDEEPEYQNLGRYPVTVILSEEEFNRFDALKQKYGASDKRLLMILMEKHDA